MCSQVNMQVSLYIEIQDDKGGRGDLFISPAIASLHRQIHMYSDRVMVIQVCDEQCGVSGLTHEAVRRRSRLFSLFCRRRIYTAAWRRKRTYTPVAFVRLIGWVGAGGETKRSGQQFRGEERERGN